MLTSIDISWHIAALPASWKLSLHFICMMAVHCLDRNAEYLLNVPMHGW